MNLRPFSVLAFTGAAAVVLVAPSVNATGQTGALVRLQLEYPGVTQAGNLHISGYAGAYSFIGGGSGLYDLNASALTLGTVNDGRLSANVAILNRPNTFTSPQTFSSMPKLPLGSAVGRVLTAIDAFGGVAWAEPTLPVPFDRSINTISPNYGFRIVNAGNAAAIRGETSHTSGIGIAGVSTATTGNAFGVYGTTASPSGVAVYGYSFANSGLATGVKGYVSTIQGVAVQGISSTGGYGGSFEASSGVGVYGYGQTGGTFRSDTAYGLRAYSFAQSGVAGSFESDGSSGVGVYATASTTSGTGTGILGVSVSPNGVGIEGRNLANGIGVYGVATGANSFAGFFAGRGYFEGNVGIGTSTPSERLEVRGGTSPTSLLFQPGKHFGVNAANKATIDIPGTGDLLLWDNVHVNNTFTAGAKNFRIDHPLDPVNKFLQHGCVESNEYKNIYDGTVVTDEKGFATVTLPGWFSALNEKFRYQLTVIEFEDSGEFVMAKVSSKLKGNQFTIRTSLPGVEVSWQVTGVRKDVYATNNPLVVEQEKPAELKGRLIHEQP